MKSVYSRAVMVSVILLIFGIAGKHVTDNYQHEEESMMSATEQNKEIVRSLYEIALNKRNLESLRGIISDDFISSLDTNTRKEQVVFIDKFSIPKQAKEEFINRMNFNRHFIRKLPGFVRDNVYEQHGEDENLIIITIAVWVNEEALNRANETVQAEYQRIGFNPQEFMERLDIKMDRGTYRELNEGV